MTKRNVVELDDLRQRLREAEETLAAIRNGEVDSLIVTGPHGDQVFSLKGAEQPYRVFVEQMLEGAVTLSGDGTILYCNRRFAEMLRSRLEKVIGSQVRVKVVKNKVAPPFKQAEFDIMYAEGISHVGLLVDIGSEANIIEKSGAWYSYNGQRIGQGRENAKLFLKDNPVLQAEIEEKVKTVLGIRPIAGTPEPETADE